MKIIKIFKVLVLTLIALALFAFFGYVSFVKIKEHRIAKAVKDGEIVIDQEEHDWGSKILYDEPLFEPVKIEMYLRNISQYTVEGNLVFSVILESKGLEEEFLMQTVGKMDESEEKFFIQVLEEMKKQGKQIRAQGEAMLSWFARGRKLKNGMYYEPVENGGENYSFIFRKWVSLKPGELIKITQQQPIPIEVRGYLLKVKIDGIEFK